MMVIGNTIKKANKVKLKTTTKTKQDTKYINIKQSKIKYNEKTEVDQKLQ